MIFTNLMSLWKISYRVFLSFASYWPGVIEKLFSFMGRNKFSITGFNRSLQRLLAYSCFGLVIFLIALMGANCGGEDGPIVKNGDKLPAKPTLRAQAGDSTVNLSWDKLQNATSYRVYMNEDAPREMSDEESNSEEMSFTFDTLENGLMHSFQVSGVNARGEGPKSDVVRMMPRPGELAAVEIDTVKSEFGDKEVTLEWSKVEHATHYRIYRLGPAGDEYNSETQGNINEDPVTTTDTLTYTESSLENGKFYFYQVEPIMEIPDEDPVLGKRGSYTGKPLGDAKNRPRVLPKINNSNDATCAIGLSISPPSEGALKAPNGYKIAVREVGVVSDVQPAIFATGARVSRTITGLTYGKSYKVIVTPTKAENLEGITPAEEALERETSQLACTRRPLARPDAPVVTETAALSLRVSWSPDPRASDYKIIRYDADGNERGTNHPTKSIADLGGEEACCFYVDTGLSERTVYRYAIQAVLSIDGDTIKSFESQQGTGRASSFVDPMDYADPIIATGSSINPSEGTSFSGNQKTNNSMGAQYPFGMVTIAPLNSMNKTRDGDRGGAGDRWTNYHDRKHRAKAFALTDIPGPGCDLASDFPFMIHDGDKSGRNLDSIIPLYINGMEPVHSRHSINDTRSNYDRTNVQAKPGYLAMTFSNNIEARFTAGPRSGIAEFTLPSTVDTATLFFTTGSRMTRHSTSLTTANAVTGQGNSIQGLIHNQGFCCNNCSAHKIYMVALFEQTPNSANPVIKTNVDGKTYNQAAYVFSRSDVGNKIRVKFGLSYVNYAGAWGNLQAEIPGWDFEKRKTDTQNEWKKMLNRIRISVPVSDREEKKDDLTIFYSSLYRSLRTPQIFSDVDQKYIGFNNSIYKTENVGARHRIQYQYFSGWDTYRSQMQLVSLIDREIAGDMAQSLINNSKQANCNQNTSVDASDALRIDSDGNIVADASCTGGGLTRWGVANDDAGIMAGEPGAIMVANTLAMGVTNFNMDQAFDAMVRGQSGVRTDNKESSGVDSHYTNSDSSRNRTRSNALELASAYFAKAAFAKRLQKFKTQSTFAAKYSFDASLLTRTGSQYSNQAGTFFQANINQFRLGSKGNDSSIPAGVTRLSRANEYQEGNSFQYQWMYPPNVAGTTYSIVSEYFRDTVATAIFSLDIHLKKLNVGDSTDGLFFGNEPGHFTPFVYCFLDQGNVYKTQEVVGKIQKDLFKNQVHNALAGNDDLGAISAWYVWSAMGLYPSIPGLGHFNVNSPIFNQIAIDFGGSGYTINIQTTGAQPNSRHKRYIKSLKLNDVAYSKVYFNLYDLVGSGSESFVEFELTGTKSEARNVWTLSPSFTAINNLDDHL